MKVNKKLIAVPAIASVAGISLAACGSGSGPPSSSSSSSITPAGQKLAEQTLIGNGYAVDTSTGARNLTNGNGGPSDVIGSAINNATTDPNAELAWVLVFDNVSDATNAATNMTNFAPDHDNGTGNVIQNDTAVMLTGPEKAVVDIIYSPWAQASAPAPTDAAPTDPAPTQAPTDQAPTDQAPAQAPAAAATPTPTPVTLGCKLANPNAGSEATGARLVAHQGAIITGTPDTSPTVDVQFIVNEYGNSPPTGPGVYETTRQVQLNGSGQGTIWVGSTATGELEDANINGTLACMATVTGS